MRTFALALLVGALAAPAPAGATPQPVPPRLAARYVEVSAHPLEPASAGCRRVDVARVGRSLLGFVVYKFHQVKRWCWDFPRITYKRVYAYVSDVDPYMHYAGVVSRVGYFYRWCCSTAYSGHYSLRVAKFQNCVPWIGCIRTEYPWVKIWVRAGGSYAYATGE
jgi:hypothetical protein